MKPAKLPHPDKYFFAEITFFVVFCWLFPILTDIEFNFNEKHQAALFVNVIGFRLLYGTFDLLAFVAFYRWIVWPYLLRRRWLHFVGAFILFLVAFNFYLKGVYYFVGHAGFFPESMAADARRYYGQAMHFSIIYVSSQCLCITALAYFIQSARHDRELRQLQEQRYRAELKYLKTQLHPHFFFNTLNNIYAVALRQSADTAPMIARLSAMMRYILYETEQSKVTLKNEIGFLTDYVEVERWRRPDSITITFDVQGVDEQHLIEPLLLLPFVENAFKHGIEEETGNGFVRFIICMTEKELNVEISNSKPSVRKDRPAGIGLANVIQRLDLLYPGKYNLDITDNEKLYQMNLTLQTA
jgi:two-component system LytT family sensor kinase